MKVYIRAPEASDCEEFISNTKKSLAMHRPWVFPVTTAFGFTQYLKLVNQSRNRAFLVCRVSDGAMVGVVSLSEIMLGPVCSAFVGYWGIYGYEGNGYLTEGTALVMEFAFDSLSLNRVEACVQPSNTKSVALLKRLGFEFEGISRKFLCIGGEWKDHERWSMLREDWASRGGALQVDSLNLDIF